MGDIFTVQPLRFWRLEKPSPRGNKNLVGRATYGWELCLRLPSWTEIVVLRLKCLLPLFGAITCIWDWPVWVQSRPSISRSFMSRCFFFFISSHCIYSSNPVDCLNHAYLLFWLYVLSQDASIWSIWDIGLNDFFGKTFLDWTDKELFGTKFSKEVIRLFNFKLIATFLDIHLKKCCKRSILTKDYKWLREFS